MAKKRPTLDEIIELTRLEGPSVVKRLRTRLHIEDAEFACEILKQEGHTIESFDFPNTISVWQSMRKDGINYTTIATEKLINKLAREKNVDPTTYDGFKKILPHLTAETFHHLPINQWGTKLQGMITKAFSDSPSKAVIELINANPRFETIRDLRDYDLPRAPRDSWISKTAIREATTLLLYRLANNQNVDPTTYDGFAKILPHLTKEAISDTPINRWGTTLSGMRGPTSVERPSELILDLINNDARFDGIRDLREYDFPSSPKNTLKNPDILMEMTSKLIETIAQEEKANPTTYEGFRKILPRLKQQNFNKTKINRWGTTLESMLTKTYNGSPSKAILDLINKDQRFEQIRDLREYDFPGLPKNSTKNKELARTMTYELVKRVAEEEKADPKTYDGLKKIRYRLDTQSFTSKPINRWGTTVYTILRIVYLGSPSKAIEDLIENHPDFQHIKTMIPKGALDGHASHHQKRLDVDYPIKQNR